MTQPVQVEWLRGVHVPLQEPCVEPRPEQDPLRLSHSVQSIQLA
jgi:hypothetical protein